MAFVDGGPSVMGTQDVMLFHVEPVVWSVRLVDLSKVLAIWLP